MTYTLYSYFRSSASYRVRIALNLKKLRYDIRPTHLRLAEHRSPDYLRINPQGMVPALEHDGQVLNQSLAIIEYLEEIEPEPPLLPAAPPARAIVRAMAQVVACDVHPLGNLRVLEYLRQTLSCDDAAVAQWCRHWIAAGFGALEAMIAEHGGAYCFGDAIGLADVCLVPQAYNARRFGCELAAYPAIERIVARLEAHPAFAQAAPEAQPDG